MHSLEENRQIFGEETGPNCGSLFLDLLLFVAWVPHMASDPHL